jgi:spore germination cell wall hydrolase CwlJ-like protein
LLLAFIAASGLAGCGGGGAKRSVRNNPDRECLARAMYFESNRSSDEGMLAVGTVVMNRVESDKFPNTVCAVVGQKKQFAPGVLSRPMTDSGRERAYRMADEVLRGKRHRGLGKKVMFFHTAGYNFPYKNMHYMALAGGNIFYEKRTPKAGERNRTQMEVARMTRPERPSKPSREVQVASAERRAAARVSSRPAPRKVVRYRQEPVPQWQAPQEPAWQEAPAAPPPVLAVAPAEPAAMSIEELILSEGGF